MTSRRHPQLSGLARNPAAPDDVLVRLAADQHGRDALSLRKEQLPDAVVEALLAYREDEPMLIRLHGHRVSPEMRARIATHPDPAVRNAFTDHVRRTAGRWIWYGIEVIEDVFGASRTTLLASPDPSVRMAVAQEWLDRPVEVQIALLADADPRVREKATADQRVSIPPDWWARCLADSATRLNVADRVPLTVEQAAELVRSGDEDVVQAVARNPHLTPEIVDLLIELDDPMVRISLAMSRFVDAETRARLYALVEAQRAERNGWAAVALTMNFELPYWLRDEPLSVRMTYLDSPHDDFRYVLASSRDLPDEAWQRLDNDPLPSVRRMAARRPGAPPDLLETVVRAYGDRDRYRRLTEHPNFPRERLRTFVDEAKPDIREVALKDADLPEEYLRRLAAEPGLRRGVAGHPNVSVALLDELLADPDPEVVDNAAANPVLALARMHRILADAQL